MKRRVQESAEVHLLLEPCRQLGEREVKVLVDRPDRLENGPKGKRVLVLKMTRDIDCESSGRSRIMGLTIEMKAFQELRSTSLSESTVCGWEGSVSEGSRLQVLGHRDHQTIRVSELSE